jgi:hypothetical protein
LIANFKIGQNPLGDFCCQKISNDETRLTAGHQKSPFGQKSFGKQVMQSSFT